MSGSWGCPHELNGLCTRVNNLPCDPGMKGCVLYGRFVFADDEKNTALRRKRAGSDGAAASQDAGTGDDAGE
ncbi:MAG TPA: hypothetical protein VMV91_12350 [Rhodocyclaceae bacterium]|nr:hypothetical protein [Rhodocyclaceae bacterium]HUX24116.1 hypothetical protein [Burkholderiales bacterium]